MKHTTTIQSWADKFIGRRYKQKHSVKEGVCVWWHIGDSKTGIWLICLDDNNHRFSIYKSIPQNLRGRTEGLECSSPST